MSPSNDMFRIVDRLRDLKNGIKNLIKRKCITVNVNGQTCKVIGQVGMCHTAIDITGQDANIGDKVKIDIKPIFIQKNIRREYR